MKNKVYNWTMAVFYCVSGFFKQRDKKDNSSQLSISKELGDEV